MPNNEIVNNRTNPRAVTAVKALIPGINDEDATDVVESVRFYIEQPLLLALQTANKRIVELQNENKALNDK